MYIYPTELVGPEFVKHIPKLLDAGVYRTPQGQAPFFIIEDLSEFKVDNEDALREV